MPNLPDNIINAVTQTKDGYIWLGTPVGLVRFDGVAFKVLDPAVVPQVPEQHSHQSGGGEGGRPLGGAGEQRLWLLQWRDIFFSGTGRTGANRT